MTATRTVLDDVKIHVKFKIAALWTAVMFCYVYGDIFNLYKPGKLDALLAGMTPMGPTSQEILLGFAILMSIPSLMVFLTLALPPVASRWLNVVLGLFFTAIMIVAIQGAWTFYVYFGVVEAVLTALIVWHALTWPRQKA